MSKNTTYAVILAAGIGSRMGGDITKQKMLICGKPMIYHTVSTFFECDCTDGIVVVGRAEELDFLTETLADFASKIHAIVVGGATRFESARAGFYALPDGVDIVAVHDGARPLITADAITRVVKRAAECGAATEAASIYDTVKSVDKNGRITATVDRNSLISARTPQVFRTDIYAKALEIAGNGENITDDNMMVEAIGVPVFAVVTNTDNPKITTMSDLKYAEFLMKERCGNV